MLIFVLAFYFINLKHKKVMKYKITKRTIFIGIVFFLCLALAACKPPSNNSNTSSGSNQSVLEEIKKRGTMKVGLGIFVPWAMKDKSGKLVGFEVDVAEKMAKDMGIEVELIPTNWDGIIPALLAKKFDVIIGGMSITPKRNLIVNFSDAYALSGLAIFANIKKASGLSTIEDFNDPSITIAVRRGATPATLAKQLFPKANILLFDEEAQVNQELLNGNAHASVASEPQPSQMIARYPEVLFRPVEEPLNKWSEGMAVRKGDPDILNFLNSWISVNQTSGWLQERHDYWFKTLDWAESVGFK
jgi:polar amino acid transport system substrate-binding protein